MDYASKTEPFLGQPCSTCAPRQQIHNTTRLLSLSISIDANASQIELLCLEKYEQVNVRTASRQADAIAVLDMERAWIMTRYLMPSLERGHTMRDARGIGKYGMGLPTSSMSQCKVWMCGVGRTVLNLHGIPTSMQKRLRRETIWFLGPIGEHRCLVDAGRRSKVNRQSDRDARCLERILIRFSGGRRQ